MKMVMTRMAVWGSLIVSVSAHAIDAAVPYSSVPGSMDRAPAVRATLKSEAERREQWFRVPLYVSGPLSVFKTQSGELARAIVSDARYQAWSSKYGTSLNDFDWLDIREVDVSRAGVQYELSSDESMLKVSVPFAAALRYRKNAIQQGTLNVRGIAHFTLSPTGHLIDCKLTAYDDSQWLEKAGRKLHILTAFDGEFANAIVIPALSSQLRDPVNVRQWLAISGAVKSMGLDLSGSATSFRY